MTDIAALDGELTRMVETAADEPALEAVRVAALGKKGSISALLSTLGKMSPEERKAHGIGTLPDNLHEAIIAAENSPLVRKILGDNVFEKLIENKKIEWEQYRRHVSDYELQRYLPIL